MFLDILCTLLPKTVMTVSFYACIYIYACVCVTCILDMARTREGEMIICLYGNVCSKCMTDVFVLVASDRHAHETYATTTH